MAITASKPRPLSRQYDEIYMAGIFSIGYRTEDLGAGADLTERAFHQAQFPLVVLDARVIPEAASAGVDGSNTILVTLRNITQAVDIATVTSTAQWAAATPVALAITAANADVAASDVLGIVVTQGAAANAPIFHLQVSVRPDTL